MFEKDYIMRLIQQFFETLELIIKGGGKNIQEKINDIYIAYIGKEKEFFQEQNYEHILDFIEEYPNQEKIFRVEMLAELLFQDAILQSNISVKINLLRKSYNLLLILDKQSKTFSLERQTKMDNILDLLNEYESFSK